MISAPLMLAARKGIAVHVGIVVGNAIVTGRYSTSVRINQVLSVQNACIYVCVTVFREAVFIVQCIE